jgi:hypothetical protein
MTYIKAMREKKTTTIPMIVNSIALLSSGNPLSSN